VGGFCRWQGDHQVGGERPKLAFVDGNANATAELEDVTSLPGRALAGAAGIGAGDIGAVGSGAAAIGAGDGGDVGDLSEWSPSLHGSRSGAVADRTPPVERAGPRQRGAADRFARWALRVREPNQQPEVHNIFSSSIALSATRCLLSYIVLPVLAPWLGTLPLIGPAIGVPVGLVALVFDVRAMRRFFQADHRRRWVAAALYLVVMVMVATLVARDISHLV
jgi:hypothetical protein